jgi:predicted nucleic acid-binding protein
MLKRRYKDDCQALLRMIDKGDIKAFVTSFSLHSIEVILDRAGDQQALKIFLESIGEFKGLSIYNTDLKDEIAVIAEMDTGLDFDDALQCYVAKKLNLKIISFDRHFDGIGRLVRLQPRDIISK